MKLKMRRVILFCHSVPTVAKFYRDVIGLKPLTDIADPGWVEFDAGATRLALHDKGQKPGTEKFDYKVVFFSADVVADRDTLNARGAKFGNVKVFGDLHLSDAEDPEGNPIQLSNRP